MQAPRRVAVIASEFERFPYRYNTENINHSATRLCCSIRSACISNTILDRGRLSDDQVMTTLPGPSLKRPAVFRRIGRDEPLRYLPQPRSVLYRPPLGRSHVGSDRHREGVVARPADL